MNRTCNKRASHARLVAGTARARLLSPAFSGATRMDMTAQTVVCDQHGERHMAFVCQHIAQSMFDQEAVGFFWSREDKSYWPDAWCNECNKRLEINNYEWEGSAAENLGAKLLCGDCYD